MYVSHTRYKAVKHYSISGVDSETDSEKYYSY